MSYAKEGLNLVKELGTSGYENVRALGHLNQRIWAKVMDKQMDTFGLIIDTGVKQWKLALESDELGALVHGQVELTREFNEELIADGREALDLATESREQYRAWFENGVSNLNRKFHAEAEIGA